MKAVNAGIIGLGVGEAHIRGYASHSQCRVAAICDIDEEKLRTVALKYPGVKTYSTAEALLDDREIDLVSIASFDNFHFPQIMRALENDKHVFVEKPLCLYEDEARAIRKLLDGKKNLRISSNLPLRTSPRFLGAKRMMQAGDLGELFYAEADYNYGRLHKLTEGWRGRLDYYSVVLGGGVHMIDLLLWLTGDKVDEVTAFANGISTNGSAFNYDDLVVALLRFRTGLVAKVCCNFGCVSPHFHHLSLYGTKSTFVNGRKAAHFYTSRDPDEEPEEIRTEYPGTDKGALAFNFVDAVIRGSAPEVTAEDIFDTMSVCFAIERSSKLNAICSVDYI